MNAQGLRHCPSVFRRHLELSDAKWLPGGPSPWLWTLCNQKQAHLLSCFSTEHENSAAGLITAWFKRDAGSVSTSKGNHVGKDQTLYRNELCPRSGAGQRGMSRELFKARIAHNQAPSITWSMEHLLQHPRRRESMCLGMAVNKATNTPPDSSKANICPPPRNGILF